MRDDDEKEPPQSPVTASGRGAHEMPCPSPMLLAALPYRRQLDPDVAQAFVRHLSTPCVACWRTIDALPTVRPGEVIRDGATERPFYLSAKNAVLRALWTVTGCPSADWLPPSRRDALERVRAPHGFLRLVIEETCSFAKVFSEARHELARWVQVADSLRPSNGFDFALEKIHAHGLLRLARCEAASPATASELIDRASKAHERAYELRGELPSSDMLFHAREALAQAAIAERHSVDFAHQQYELAAGYLVATRLAPHRAEILLEHADLLLRTHRLDEAAQRLEEAQRAIERLEGFRLLGEHRKILHAELALARSKAAASYSALQFVHLAEARGRLANTTRLGRHHDCALCHRRIYLRSRIVEQERNLPKDAPACRSIDELRAASRVWMAYSDIIEVRNLLGPILERHFPRISKTAGQWERDRQ